MKQFEATVDINGGINIAMGTVVYIPASGTSTIFVLGDTAPLVRKTPTQYRDTYAGGDAEDVLSTGTLTGTSAPVGFFRRNSLGTWVDEYGNVMTFDSGTGDGEIAIGTDVIATATGMTLAPAGTFSSTTYGETNYNGGNPFTLTTSYAGGATTDINVTSDAALGLTTMPQTDFNEWTSTTWVLTTDPTTTELTDGTNIVATGEGGANGYPARKLESTTYGETTYNDDVAFSVFLFSDCFPSVEGYVYVTLELDTGAVTGATGPHFATSLPTNSSTEEHIPICHSDGTGKVLQIHSGPIHYRSA